ncbi:hypothetical protein PGRAN_15787 [Listeria grandensis FSL F6-0971]|uniref:Uncharacterized protein n=1 Tax=Listeria grandensis FSL F6-0971 TaxID=1265819 RepID=W7ATU4_9LIST|nr:hypothetical protein PGRAN_15787 [Listeria grandensis FSL F6-0971]
MEILQIEDVSFDNQKMNVCFSVDSKDIPLYEYAYYVYYNEAIIERHGYSPIKTKNTCFSFEPIESGSYSFRIFIRLNGKLIAHQISPPIHLDLRMNEQVETNFNAEKVYMNDVPLKYILEDHSTISDRLLVVFAGIHTREFQGGRGVFNYYRTLKHLKVNKLFLLDDYQGQFCYYMGLIGLMILKERLLLCSLKPRISYRYRRIKLLQ